jgi:hypothetical protein
MPEARDQAAASAPELATGFTCECGHTADWHSHGGTGDCEHVSVYETAKEGRGRVI